MKKVTLLVAAVLCSLGSFAQEQYPVNWDKDANLAATRADRVLSTITLNTENADPQIIELGSTGVVYNDLSDQKLNVQPGESLEFKLNYSGTWMHACYYVDMNQDGQFEWNDITPGQPGSELLSYAFWSGDLAQENSGYASDGTYKTGSARSAIDAPAFNAPEQPGEYRLRVKLDWNNIDPAGQYGSNYTGNFIDANGGYIVDLTLVVEGAVDPEPPVVEPEELTWSAPEAGGIYAIVNLQPTGNNFYLDYLDGNLSPVSAADCNSLFEWPETAKFQAVELADGRFAFKNCGTGNYLAWKGTANRNNTTGVYNNQGYDPAINEHSSWTLNESARYEGAYWLRAEQRNDIPNDGQNVTGSPIISNAGDWNAWTTGEYLPANGTAFSNSFAFYLIEKGETPVDPEPPVVEPEFDYAAAVAPVLEAAYEALDGHDDLLRPVPGVELITRSDQFSSPHSDPAEGNFENLLDYNNTTIWHSNWHNGDQPAHSHYLQVELDEPVDGELELAFLRRYSYYDHVTGLEVETSMDGENFTHAVDLEMPAEYIGNFEHVNFTLDEKAKYFRFWASATTSNRGYWHCAGLQLRCIEYISNPCAPDYAYPSAVAALQNAVETATTVENGTQDDVDALEAAIEAYKKALAGYPEVTEWNGGVSIDTDNVSSLDDLCSIDYRFMGAATVEPSTYGVLGAVYDQTGDVYALVFDGLFGSVEVEKEKVQIAKNDFYAYNVAHVQFEKIANLSAGLQEKAKGIAAKIGGFQAAEGHALVVLASKSFLVDGERLTFLVKFEKELTTGTITGIENLIMNSKGEIFDLQGRRVNNAQNGLFIQNGKKVLR